MQIHLSAADGVPIYAQIVNQVKYLIASLLTLHFHYLFGFIFVIQAVFVAGCRWFGGRTLRRRVGIGLPLAAAILLPASMLPLVGVLRSSASHARSFAHAIPPTFTQLLQSCFPPALLLTIGLGLLLLWISARKLRWQPARMRPEFVLLLATWATLAPVIFFLAARLTDNSVFASRYLLFTLPAAVLFIVWVISGFERPEWRFLILLAIFAGTVLHPGSVGCSACQDPSGDPHVSEAGSPHARYAIVHRSTAAIGAELIAVEYDHRAASARAATQGRADCAHAMATGYAMPLSGIA